MVYGMPIDHSKSQPTDDKLSLKWAWLCHVIHFKLHGPKHTSRTTVARIVKFHTQLSDVTKRTTYHPLNGHGYGHVTVLKFCRCHGAASRAGLSATAELLVETILVPACPC